jgi:hypothetical protein|tara:strand:+ start:421 stop:936 length:516 start_codon:yes stop_codon:yes gene_type:complete
MNLRQKRTSLFNDTLKIKWNNILDNNKDYSNIKKYINIEVDNKIKIYDNIFIKKLCSDIETHYYNIEKNITFNHINQFYSLYSYLVKNKILINDIHLNDHFNNTNLFEIVYDIYEMFIKINKDYKKYVEQSYKIYLATYKIQQWWKKIVYDPNKKFVHNIMNNRYDNYNIT